MSGEDLLLRAIRCIAFQRFPEIEIHRPEQLSGGAGLASDF